jgi:truncated hemoglobin YjbI
MENDQIKIPSLYEWAGGMPVFEKLTDLFYKKVLSDELLEPVFKHMSKEHQLHVAHFIAEVFGGPEMYSTSGRQSFQNDPKAFIQTPHRATSSALGFVATADCRRNRITSRPGIPFRICRLH